MFRNYGSLDIYETFILDIIKIFNVSLKNWLIRFGDFCETTLYFCFIITKKCEKCTYNSETRIRFCDELPVHNSCRLYTEF